jgi:dTDP-4-amino-4,6-dideoxygalactose transaminase
VHHTGAFADSEYKPGDFPVTERAAEEILSLPLFPGITVAQQERVAEVLRAAVGHDG